MTSRSCFLVIDRFKPGDFMTVGMNEKRAAWFLPRFSTELCIRRSSCVLKPLHPPQQIKGLTMAKMTRNQLIDAVSESSAVSKNDVKAVMEHLATVGYKELNESGEFVIPGFVKMSVVNKPATEARSGVNPFTKEPMEFAAKPASKTVKASPLKVAKDAV
jgi:DNA-binding protein HU-beta